MSDTFKGTFLWTPFVLADILDLSTLWKLLALQKHLQADFSNLREITEDNKLEQESLIFHAISL